ncbi:MAG: GHKL domain-containing protein [Desulfobacteraceae bacterium]|nr:GHKL domain-containing protein [Desulfobacteraceae bacterium]
MLLLFLLGIGLPSLLLGYLAFRGIQNDQALVEKNRLSEHRRIAELITKSIDENISEVEQKFLTAIENRQNISPPALIRSLVDLKRENPLANEVFFFEDLEKIRLPAAKLLYLPDSSTKSYSVSSPAPSLLKKIQTGQQLEFQKKRYQRALDSYQQAMEQVSDPQLKGELLSAVARVQKKSNHIQDAIESYKTLFQDFSQVRIAEGTPLGLAARLELGSLFWTISDSSGSLKTYIELYKALIHREWMLEEARYNFFSTAIKASIDEIFSKPSLPVQMQSYKSSYQLLENEERRQRSLTEKLLVFQENSITDLQAKAAPNLSEPFQPAKRFLLEIGKHSYLVSLLGKRLKESDQTHEIWGLLLDTKYLRDNLLQQALQHHVPSEKTGWILKGNDGQVILRPEQVPSGSVTLKTDFAGNFPPWRLEFYQQGSPLLETFLTSQRGIYFYMFLLIAGILVFGLILTMRIVTRELELAKMKSDFVSTISHEFKSPLTSIRQLAEMLQAGRVPSEKRRRKYYDVLVEQSERLSLLTDNVLNIAKLEEGKKEFKLEKIDMGGLLKEIVSTIQEQVRHKGFVIQLKSEKSLPPIKVDSTAITQAVTNLLDNAIKFSGESREIIVRSFKENQHIVISVKDFGSGIRKDEVDKVFERFHRGGDELTRTVKGSGLGLTIVKQIIEAHQGKVSVESEPGSGSTFSIRLPLQ